MAIRKGALILKMCNCLVLISVVVVLIYDNKVTSELRQSAQSGPEAQRRSKRSADGQDDGDAHVGAVTYTRWGKTACEGPDVELVYAGVAGGSLYSGSGGGSNYLCLPTDPLWDIFDDADGNNARVYGAEYESDSSPFNRALHDHNVPCAVCRRTKRTSLIMIPARNKCYDGWTAEYHGYLMAERNSHAGRTEFVCMDQNPEADVSGYRNENGALFYSTEGVCGSLPCPPYVNGRELTCVVCTK